MQNFEIDDQFLTNVTIHKEWSMYAGKKLVTEEELIKILKGLDRCSTTWNEDHPEFKKLRDYLEDKGYIQTQRNYWNGDRVKKPFTLNEYKFNTGEAFPCSAAMSMHLKLKKK